MKRRILKAERDNPDLSDRLRQFQVVCKIAIQLNVAGSHTRKRADRISLHALGREFGLNEDQVNYCVGRTKNFLDDIRQAERLRNAAKFKRNPPPYAIAA